MFLLAYAKFRYSPFSRQLSSVLHYKIKCPHSVLSSSGSIPENARLDKRKPLGAPTTHHEVFRDLVPCSGETGNSSISVS